MRAATGSSWSSTSKAARRRCRRRPASRTLVVWVKGWVSLRSAPDGTVFGRRAGEKGPVRLDESGGADRVGAAHNSGLCAGPCAQLSATMTRGRSAKMACTCARAAHRPDSSSIWMFPWQGAERRVADAAGVGKYRGRAKGDVLVSQGTTLDIDLAMLELKPVS